MSTRALRKFVKRYTTLSSALQTLNQKKLVLLSPSKWDDANDAYFMDLYRAKTSSPSVLALCCTMAKETYHHWRVFTSGIDGVSIEFHREPLERAVKQQTGFRAGPVNYMGVHALEQSTASGIEILPFVKREGYSDEREWRIIAKCDEVREYADLPIELDWINTITFNPWMPPSLTENLRGIIHQIAPDAKIPLRASSLTNSRAWKDAGRNLAGT